MKLPAIAISTAGRVHSNAWLATFPHSNKPKEDAMKLYGFAGSPRTWKVRALAAHLGIPLEYENLDAIKGDNRTPQYLALNPTGRTPTLVDGDFVLWESD